MSDDFTISIELEEETNGQSMDSLARTNYQARSKEPGKNNFIGGPKMAKDGWLFNDCRKCGILFPCRNYYEQHCSRCEPETRTTVRMCPSKTKPTRRS